MTRQRLLMRANAVYLGLGALNGLFLMDIPGIFFNRGPASVLLGPSTDAGIGLIEAHGLALIISILFWHAAALRLWHVAAAATGLLLGVSNLIFWQGFVRTDTLPMGYIATTLHLSFAAMQIVAAMRAPASAAAGGDLRHAVV